MLLLTKNEPTHLTYFYNALKQKIRPLKIRGADFSNYKTDKMIIINHT